MTQPATPHRPRRFWRAWLLFILFCCAYAGADFGLRAAARRVADRERGRQDCAWELEDRLSRYTESREALERDFNDGKPLPSVTIKHQHYDMDRVLLDAQKLGARYDGWTVRIDYPTQSRSSVIFNQLHPMPPRVKKDLIGWLGSDEVQNSAQEFHAVLLILCLAAWAIMILLMPAAGKFRRSLAQIAIAASLLAILIWAINPDLEMGRSHDRILQFAVFGVVAGLLGFAAPVRIHHNRPGRCANCRYDLTGNVSGICPECGKPTAALLRSQRDAELAPLADAIQQTTLEPESLEIEMPLSD